jgi:phage/plasmid primase-like uncharacterized protein/KaiC/GvpD/RAD55 family RecA-like ATPase
MSVDIDIFEAMRAFADAMRERGIVPPDGVEADGKLHRVDIDGKKGKKDAAYLFHSDGLPSGGFENWADGLGWQNWCAKDLAQLSDEEAKEQRARVAESRRVREEEDKQRKQNARTRAEQIWNDAKDCERHPYLSAKGVPAFGVKESRGSLVVPMRDIAGVIHSLQFIGEDGGKKYLAGGKKQACFALLGEPGGVLCVSEGYATGASIHEACGFAVFVAFDCGNLAPVAEEVRAKYPEAKIIVCADDDHATEGNPGITKANDAAKKVGGTVATPSFRNRGAKDTDWNDLAKTEGLQEVAYQISVAVLSDAGPIYACDLFPAVIADLEARKGGKAKSTVLTGIDSVDRFTGGIRKGYLTTIGGLPGSGKTSAMAGIMAYNARNEIPALIFSLEMDRSDIAIRMLSMSSNVTASSIFDDRKPKEAMDWDAVKLASERMRYWDLTIDDRALSISQICEQTHRWYVSKVLNAKRETGIIAIDYLGLIRSEERTDNRNREVAALVKESKLLAKTLRAPVILLSQLSREAAKRGGEPMNSDLRDSGEIEAASDLIMFPFPAPRDEDGNIEKDSDNQEKPDLWIVGKNKNGMKGRVRVKWIPETMTYTDAVRQFNGEDNR